MTPACSGAAKSVAQGFSPVYVAQGFSPVYVWRRASALRSRLQADRWLRWSVPVAPDPAAGAVAAVFLLRWFA